MPPGLAPGQPLGEATGNSSTVFGSIVAWLLRHGITSLKKLTEGFLRAPFSSNNLGGSCNEVVDAQSRFASSLERRSDSFGREPCDRAYVGGLDRRRVDRRAA